MAEDEAADRPGSKANREGREGEQGADEGIVAGKEQLVEDDAGGDAEQEESASRVTGRGATASWRVCFMAPSTRVSRSPSP